MKIAICQLNPTVGDLEGNTRRICAELRAAHDAGAELTIFPELATMGYPPLDLLAVPNFIAQNNAAIDAILECSHACDIGVVLGTVWSSPARAGKELINAAVCIDAGEMLAVQAKSLLPTYDVFDETRYFSPAQSHAVVEFRGRRFALTVCEDLWFADDDVMARERYAEDPLCHYEGHTLDAVINLSASPFVVQKIVQREAVLQRQAQRFNCPVIYCNQTGGNDQLIFDGHSAVSNASGEIVARAAGYAEDLVCVDLSALPAPIGPYEESIADVGQALVLGLRDYVQKCGFAKVLIGVSGGIDSAVVAALAVEALGTNNVSGVAMPSPFSSAGSVADAEALCQSLGISYRCLAIHDVYGAYREIVGSGAELSQPDLAEENLQARIRGSLLMTLSNREGALVLTTGNKSELAVGYCTLYGDMNGGLAVLADVPKMQVYELAQWLNRDELRIPESTITKAPSAELRPDQADAQSLPPYPVLDAILERYIEQHESAAAIIEAGVAAPEVVAQIIQLVHRNEYKRAQAAPGLKIRPRAFGMGRRWPIAAGWRG